MPYSPGASSPLRTPPTERAVRIAREGLDAAEVLSLANMHIEAAEVTASAFEAAASAYAEQAKRPRQKTAAERAHARTPLGEMTNAARPASGLTDSASKSVRWRAAACKADDIKAVIITGAPLVRHALPEDDSRPFTLYQLHVPLTSGEHIAFRRFSHFVALDDALRGALRVQQLRKASLRGPPANAASAFGELWGACMALRPLPSLPPKTLPVLQDATHPHVVSQRWASLQRYLDAALEHVAECPEALDAFKEFLDL